MTGEPTVETATESLRAGACDYLFKPISKAAILRAAANAARIKVLEDTRRRLEDENRGHRENLERLVAERTAQLRASETLYHSLVENLPQYILRKDLAGRFTFANQRLCQSLGQPLEAILGRTDADFFPADLVAKYQADDRQVMESGQSLEAVEAHQLPAGELRFMQVLKTPPRNGFSATPKRRPRAGTCRV
jgi:PAS domain S-box-containing protein